jgi:hypothetical protein
MIKKALCIGNAAYPGDPLINPSNDAESISRRLEALSFSCMLLKNASISQMDASIKAFSEELKDSDVGLFFFAGHGMQIDGENYLTAIDTDFYDENAAKYSSHQLSRIIDVLEKGTNSTSIVILDACRNNPYERQWRGVGSRGLAPVYAPKGTIIAFATSPGQVALDGNGNNGRFTSALLSHIDTQNLTIEDFLKRVRNTLSASTAGRQTSWEHTSLMGDFFFNTSILTGEFVAEYSKEACADALFDTSGARSVFDIIRKLKSYNWYTQNPAVNSISSAALLGADKNDLFVLGRNLYQSACGGSTAALAALSSLGSFLAKLEDEVSFHILNGMLFEIYFNSSGRLRMSKKTQRMEELLALEDDISFARSFEFIRQALLPHQKELFYLPGVCRVVAIDVILSPMQSESLSVKSIMIEGQDTFYAGDGHTLISSVDDPALRSRSVSQFESEVLEMMALPSRRRRLTYTPALPDRCCLLLPYEFKIQRLAG